jgi:tetratricopeptide (TPR) repeat protein
MSRKQGRSAAKLKKTPTRQPTTQSSARAHSVAELLATGRTLHQVGRLAEAEALYRRVLADQPNHAGALNLLGALAHQTGRHELAIEAISQAIQQNGKNPDYFFNLGGVFHGHGKLDQAVDAYHQAINIKRDFVEARYNLGIALKDQGKLAEAVEAYRQAIHIRPDFVEAHYNLGIALHEQGRRDEAIVTWHQAISFKPDHASAHYNLGVALYEQGRRDEAIAAYRHAISIKADDAKAHLKLGIALYEQGRRDEATAAWRQAIRFKPDLDEACYNLGVSLSEKGGLDEAIAAWRQVLSIKPDHAKAHYSLGLGLIDQGKLGEARSVLERAVALAPRSAATYRVLGETKRFSTTDPHLVAMQKLAREMASLSSDDQIELHFALAKAYEDLGEHEQSALHLIKGNALKRQQINYDEAATLNLFCRIQEAFPPGLMYDKRNVGDPSPVPVFVIGMPRSGTTLVEQILASHPQAFGAGELDKVDKGVAQLRSEDVSVCYPEVISSMTNMRLRQFGTSYVGAISALAPTAKRITDKTPKNFLFAGLIHLTLPNARIIHVRRDPLDTCFSCFSKLFADEQRFSYDLGELGRFYRAYESLMGHWRSVLPSGVMLEVQYEQLITDLEAEARRMVAHCGLSWNEACLSFQATQRPVRTASAVQVRQPIYRSSIGRWRPYARQLGPLIEALGVDVPDSARRTLFAGATDGCAPSSGASPLPSPDNDVTAGARSYRRDAPAADPLRGEARGKQLGGEAPNREILVDDIKAVTVHNGLLRIDCVAVSPNNEKRSAGILLIPGNRAGRILRSLTRAVQDLDKKMRQLATAGQTAN